MINFFRISTVWFWSLHTGQETHLSFCTGKHKPISSSLSSPAPGITWTVWLEKIKHIISSKHLSFQVSYLKANNLYLALCWRTWSTQCPHLLPSTTKIQPFLLIKRYPETTQLSELCPSIMSLTLCEPETHKTLLFSTQKVGERTSEVQLDETVLKMRNKVLFQATWSVLSQGEFWECSGKSKPRNGYKSRLVYSALCSPHSTGNYVEMTKGRRKTSTRTQLFMQSGAVHTQELADSF